VSRNRDGSQKTRPSGSWIVGSGNAHGKIPAGLRKARDHLRQAILASPWKTGECCGSSLAGNTPIWRASKLDIPAR